MISISALVITQNEEKHIGRCLDSLTWANEIVVVDAESTDRTKAICTDPQAPWAKKMNFLSRSWTGFKDQRTFALHNAKNDWVIVVDADECVSPELKEKIISLLSEPGGPKQKYYKLRRQEYFLQKPIHYGIWNPSYQDRFFYRPGVVYQNDIHEYPIYPSAPDRIHEPLIHSPDFGPEKFLYKMNKYTSIEAMDRFLQGKRTNVFRLFFAFPAMFLKNYFYYRAYRDGYAGFVISLLEGISRVVRHVKIWQIQNERGVR